mmetsp:Transcript_18787/g.38653  ORF Transcript_18787/g.38653 Transcript_18787/m.38653 type:complete len:308 (-) Transcript_18787:30-953(-)
MGPKSTRGGSNKSLVVTPCPSSTRLRVLVDCATFKGSFTVCVRSSVGMYSTATSCRSPGCSTPARGTIVNFPSSLFEPMAFLKSHSALTGDLFTTCTNRVREQPTQHCPNVKWSALMCTSGTVTLAFSTTTLEGPFFKSSATNTSFWPKASALEAWKVTVNVSASPSGKCSTVGGSTEKPVSSSTCASNPKLSFPTELVLVTRNTRLRVTPLTTFPKSHTCHATTHSFGSPRLCFGALVALVDLLSLPPPAVAAEAPPAVTAEARAVPALDPAPDRPPFFADAAAAAASAVLGRCCCCFSVWFWSRR